MLKVRNPEFNEEDEFGTIDWEDVAEEDMDLFFNNELELKRRYDMLFPDYSKLFIDNYTEYDNDKLGELGVSKTFSILGYLEQGFEVDMDKLEKLSSNSAIVEFSTGNYPFGGLERFIIVLKSFDLIPTEAFNGFTIYSFNWLNDFEYEAVDLVEKTKLYLNK